MSLFVENFNFFDWFLSQRNFAITSIFNRFHSSDFTSKNSFKKEFILAEKAPIFSPVQNKNSILRAQTSASKTNFYVPIKKKLQFCSL